MKRPRSQKPTVSGGAKLSRISSLVSVVGRLIRVPEATSSKRSLSLSCHSVAFSSSQEPGVSRAAGASSRA